MATDQIQYLRQYSLQVLKPPGSAASDFALKGLDLSSFHFTFATTNQDGPSMPSSCVIRVFNLSSNTVQDIIRSNYATVILQAGYEGQFGVIFQGNIKQFRVGRIDGKDSYLDILAGDGDLAFNFAYASVSLSKKQNTHANVVGAVIDAMKPMGVTLGYDQTPDGGIPRPRGKVLFGMARAVMEDACNNVGSTWSIQNGKIVVLPLTGYLPGEAVKLTAATGLIGVPEATQDGVICRCLLNPRIRVGSRIQIDNKSINQTVAQSQLEELGAGQQAFNQIGAGSIQFFASVANDGFYRVYVCEHEGDSRGNPWYTKITALAIDNTTGNIKPYG